MGIHKKALINNNNIAILSNRIKGILYLLFIFLILNIIISLSIHYFL